MSIVCTNCQTEINVDEAKYCPSCGEQLQTMRKRFQGFVSKASQVIQEKSEVLKERTAKYRDEMTQRLDGYIADLQNNRPLSIAGHEISWTRKQQLIRQLERIRNSISREDFASDEEYEEWISHLDDRISNKKCIICFGLWSDDDEVVVCKHCVHGGHRDHFENWIANNAICPLCRQEIGKADLMEVKTVSA